MKRIITVQHAQSVHHLNGMVGSWTDWDLSEEGARQAEALARNLAQEIGGEKWRIYTSDLRRAKQTAAPIARELGAQATETEALRERNLGAAVGRSVEWLRKNIQREEKTVYDRCFEDAESEADVWHRLEPFLAEIMASQDDNILLVSHGNTLGVFFSLWLGLELDILSHAGFWGSAGGVSFLEEGREGKRLIRRISDMCFLKME